MFCYESPFPCCASSCIERGKWSICYLIGFLSYDSHSHLCVRHTFSPSTKRYGVDTRGGIIFHLWVHPLCSTIPTDFTCWLSRYCLISDMIFLYGHRVRRIKFDYTIFCTLLYSFHTASCVILGFTDFAQLLLKTFPPTQALLPTCEPALLSSVFKLWYNASKDCFPSLSSMSIAYL